MMSTDLKFNFEKLLALRASLLGDMTHMEGDSLTGPCQDRQHSDRQGRTWERQCRAGTHACRCWKRRRHPRPDRAAIRRIENGSYGRCKNCGEPIPKTRQDAVPYAADCVRCASQEETMTHITKDRNPS